METFTRTKLRPVNRKSMLLGILRKHWFMTVWLVVAITCWWLYSTNPKPLNAASMRGVVESEVAIIAPVETARIKSILVAEGDVVDEGQVLAEMDTSLIDGGITADVVDITTIRTSFGDTHQDVLQAVSQQRDAISALQSDMALCRQEWQREKGELEALKKEQARRDKMRKQGYIDDLTQGELVPMIAALESAVAEYPSRMSAYSSQVDNAVIYHRHILEWLGASDDETTSEAIAKKLDEGNIMELLDKAEAEAKLVREVYTLRAPKAGTVSLMGVQAGTTVAAGMPIMRVVSTNSGLITAFPTERQLAGMTVGQVYTVSPAARDGIGKVTAEVISITPDISVSAYQVSSFGDFMPLCTGKAQLRLYGQNGLISGEAVHLLRYRPGLVTQFLGLFSKNSGLKGNGA